MPIRDHNPSHKFPAITVVIISINVVAFLFEMLSEDPVAFIKAYGLVKSNLSLAEPSSFSTFVSTMFLHGGILHIGSNMLFLWVFGDNIEAALGKIRFILFYLGGGIAASLVQLPVTSPDIPIIGASGAIAAILVAYLVLYPKARIDVLLPIFFIPIIITVPASFMLVYWFITQLFAGVISLGAPLAGGGIAFFAHVGGFLAGFWLIKYLRPKTSLS